jgi:hypothetical protein
VGWLHRLTHHSHKVVAQRGQIGIITQLGGEVFECLPRVVLPPVEAAVYEGLDAMPQLCLRGVNNAAISRVEATTARVDSWLVSKTKNLCNTTMAPT